MPDTTPLTLVGAGIQLGWECTSSLLSQVRGYNQTELLSEKDQSANKVRSDGQ